MKNTYRKSQRIVAWIGIILLVILYITTIVSAILATPASSTLFRACILGSVLIPLMIFGYSKLAKLLTDR